VVYVCRQMNTRNRAWRRKKNFSKGRKKETYCDGGLPELVV